MTFDEEQRGILRASMLALAFDLTVILAGYTWLPAGICGLGNVMAAGDRTAFALRFNIPLFI